MPDEYKGSDGLRLYFTGASTDGGAQPDPNASLGNHRAENEVQPLAWDLFNLLKGITVEHVAGACGIGNCSIQAADGDQIRFVAPGEDYGETEIINQGETKVLESGASRSKSCRVHRWGSEPLAGVTTIKLSRWFNNVIGMSNITDPERLAGEEKVRCICLKAVNALGVDSIKGWITPLAPGIVSDVQQLPAIGTGFIESTGSIEDAPTWGFLRVEDAGGTLKEICLFTRRYSESKFEVAYSNHRGLLGTSATAGAATDVVYWVPGIRFGWQDPTAQPDGAASIAATENDLSQLGGITWHSHIRRSEATPFNLATTNIKYLWFRLSLPACLAASNVATWLALNGFAYDFLPGE